MPTISKLKWHTFLSQNASPNAQQRIYSLMQISAKKASKFSLKKEEIEKRGEVEEVKLFTSF